MIICACSDKGIEIFDMNEAKSCLTIHSAHTRQFHQITQNSSDLNKQSYDLFLTNCIGDCIKLWDIRIAK